LKPLHPSPRAPTPADVEKATHPQGGLKQMWVRPSDLEDFEVEKATHPQGGLKQAGRRNPPDRAIVLKRPRIRKAD